MHRIMCSGACFAAMALSAGHAGAAVISLEASRDNTLIEDFVDGSLSNGAFPGLFAGKTGQFQREIRRGLLFFDLSAAGVSVGSQIHSATLTLYMDKARSPLLDTAVSVRRMTADWGEGASVGAGNGGIGGPAAQNDATWLYRFYDVNNPPASAAWATPGGDFVGFDSAVQTVGGGNAVGFYSWTGAGPDRRRTELGERRPTELRLGADRQRNHIGIRAPLRLPRRAGRLPAHSDNRLHPGAGPRTRRAAGRRTAGCLASVAAP